MTHGTNIDLDLRPRLLLYFRYIYTNIDSTKGYYMYLMHQTMIIFLFPLGLSQASMFRDTAEDKACCLMTNISQTAAARDSISLNVTQSDNKMQ